MKSKPNFIAFEGIQTGNKMLGNEGELQLLSWDYACHKVEPGAQEYKGIVENEIISAKIEYAFGGSGVLGYIWKAKKIPSIIITKTKDNIPTVKITCTNAWIDRVSMIDLVEELPIIEVNFFYEKIEYQLLSTLKDQLSGKSLTSSI